MATTSTKSSSECQTNYLFDSHIQILGIYLLKNERKGFEAEVQNSMSNLIQKANDTSQSTPTTELSSVVLRIPTSLAESVEIIFEETSPSKLEYLVKSMQEKQSELFAEDGSTDLQKGLSKLFSEPVKIPVNQLFFYRGQLNTPTERCLALTTNFTPLITHGNNAIHRYQQCFFLYAESPAKVTDILDMFRKLLGIGSARQASPISAMLNTTKVTEYNVGITAGLEIQEEISEGKWHSCPIEKESFKLRTHLDKKICISLQQDVSHFSFPLIKVERCFGMLLSPGVFDAVKFCK